MIKRIGLFLLLISIAGCKGPGGRSGGGGGGGEREKESGTEFIKRLDKNGDSKVSKDEFDGPEEHFSMLDKNGDGFLTEDEAPSGPPSGRRM